MSDEVTTTTSNEESGDEHPTEQKTKQRYQYHPYLPPCRICGARASGCHFGTITCEACKVFFRRSFSRKRQYKCRGQENCEIHSKRRGCCSYCRLQKCLRFGMALNNIQKGRYTVERKTECILEANKALRLLGQDVPELTQNIKIEERRPVSSCSSTGSCINSSSPASTATYDIAESPGLSPDIKWDLSVKTPEDITDANNHQQKGYEGHNRGSLTEHEDRKVDKINQLEVRQSNVNSDFVPISPASQNSPEMVGSSGKYMKLKEKWASKHNYEESLSCNSDDSSSLCDRHDNTNFSIKIENESDNTSSVNSSLSLEKNENLVKKLVDLSKKYQLMNTDMIPQLREKELRYKETVAAKQSIFGPLRPLPKNLYHEIYRKTGIDVDERRQVIQKCVGLTDTALVTYLEYAKHLPGFKELCLEDRVNISRSACIPWWFMSTYRSLNVDLEIVHCILCDAMHTREDMGKLMSTSGVDAYYKALGGLQKLQLTDVEQALVMALLLFNDDGLYEPLQNASLVRGQREQILTELLLHLNTSRPNGNLFFARIVSALTELQDAVLEYRKMILSWFNDWNDLNVPRLFAEMTASLRHHSKLSPQSKVDTS